MKTWNLLSFDELSPQVLSSVDETSTASIPLRKKLRRAAKTAKMASLSSLGAAVLVSAIAVMPIRVQVTGSDESLRLTVNSGIWNVGEERPPLHLLFGDSHRTKWSDAEERDMLERALAATKTASAEDNRLNVINSALTEELPADRKDAVDLRALGIKRG
jgi:hypothetical protein